MIMNCLQAFIGGYLISYGFGILFNISDRKALRMAGMTGATGTFIYQASMEFGFGDYIANFLGSLAFSWFAEIQARRLKKPVTVFSAPALIPLVPGGTVFQTLLAFSKNQLFTGLNLSIKCLTISAMLVLGIMVISTIYTLVSKAKRKEEPDSCEMKSEL